MKPFLHARISAKQFGGPWQAYQAVHDFFDTSKGALPDMRHRLMLHSDLGCRIAGQVFGESLTPEAGKTVPVAMIAWQHQEDDLGRVVPLTEWLSYVAKPQLLKIRRRYPEYEPFNDDAPAACVARWGGQAAAYEPVLAWFRQSVDLGDGHPMAEAVLLNAFGIMLSERVFGPVIEVAADRLVPTRDIGEALTLARFGRIPTLEQILSDMKTAPWMYGSEVAHARRAARDCGIPLTD